MSYAYIPVTAFITKPAVAMIATVNMVGNKAEKLSDTLVGTVSGIFNFKRSWRPSQQYSSIEAIATNIPRNNPFVSVYCFARTFSAMTVILSAFTYS